MSEENTVFFEASFNRSVKIRARDHRLSSNGGVFLLREATSVLASWNQSRRNSTIRVERIESGTISTNDFKIESIPCKAPV